MPFWHFSPKEKAMRQSTKYLFTACISVLLATHSTKVEAAAFYLPIQSTSAYGTSLAGAASQVRDASIIYYNPAGMVHLDGAQGYISADVIFPGQSLENTGSTLGGAPVGGQDSDNPLPLSVVPSAFFAQPVNDSDLWLGIGITSPFGLVTQYRGDWFGRFDSIESELKTIDVQPTMAYKVNNWLSIGGGINFQYAEGELGRAVTDGFSTGLSTLEGEDFSFGFNAGVMIKPFEDTTVGVHYRSRMNHKLDGRVIVSGTNFINEDSPASAVVNLPDTVFIGVSQKVTDKLTLMGEADWFGWNSFDDLTVIRDNGTVASQELQNYKTTWMLAAGAEYEVNDKLTLRAGYHYDPTPTKDEFRTTQVPDGDRHVVNAGFSYDLTEKIRLDFATGYLTQSDENINSVRNAGLANTRIRTDNSEVFLLSAGLRYKF